jgi:nucleotide-binding universal stress UspA family protein
MARSHVLVAFEDSPWGRRTLEDAAVVARQSGGRLTVVSFAEIERPSRCCNRQTTFWNAEMRRVAAEDLERARALLPDEEAQFVIREDGGRGAMSRTARELKCDLVAERRRRKTRFRTPAVA